mgnify:CR=1 FL=1
MLCAKGQGNSDASRWLLATSAESMWDSMDLPPPKHVWEEGIVEGGACLRCCWHLNGGYVQSGTSKQPWQVGTRAAKGILLHDGSEQSRVPQCVDDSRCCRRELGEGSRSG